MELYELLGLADAPEELESWAKGLQLDFDAAWVECGRGDHRVWVAACGGSPLEEVVEAGAACVLHVEEMCPDAPSTIGDAAELAVAGADQEELLAAAERCERLAREPSTGYRSAAGPGLGGRARAAALVARAAEALSAGEAQREAGRLQHAQAVSAALGVGVQTVLPPDEGPTRLDLIAGASRASHGTLLFVVAAVAAALGELEDAVATLEDSREVARRAIDQIAKESFET